MANKVVLPIKGAYITKKSDTKDTKKSSKKKKTSSNKSKATETASKMTSTEKAKHKSVTLPGKKSTSSALSTNAITGNSFKSEKNSFGNIDTSTTIKKSKDKNGKLSADVKPKNTNATLLGTLKNNEKEAQKQKDRAQEIKDKKAKLKASLTQEEIDKYKFDPSEVTKKLAITGRGSDAVRKENERVNKLVDKDIENAPKKAEKQVRDEVDVLQTEAEAKSNAVVEAYNSGKIDKATAKAQIDEIYNQLEKDATKVTEKYGEYANNYAERVMSAYGASRTKFSNTVESGATAVEEGALLLANGFPAEFAALMAQQYNPNKKGGAIASGRTGKVLPYGGYTKDQLKEVVYSNGRTSYTREDLLMAKAEDWAKWGSENELAQFVKGIQSKRALMDQVLEGSNKTVNDVISQTAMNVPTMLISMVQPQLGISMFGFSAAGLASMEAYESGATIQEAVDYGVLSGMLEIATEKMFPAVGKAYGATWHGLIGKKLKSKVYRMIYDDTKSALITSKFANSMSGKILRDVLASGGEATEEMIAEIIDPYLQRATYNPTADDASKQEIIESGLMGLAVSAVLGVPINTMSLANKDKANYALESMTEWELDVWVATKQAELKKKVDEGKITVEQYTNECAKLIETYNNISSQRGFSKAKSTSTKSYVKTDLVIADETDAIELANAQAESQKEGSTVSVIIDNDGKLTRRTYNVVNQPKVKFDDIGNVYLEDNFVADESSATDKELTVTESEAIKGRYSTYKDDSNITRSTGAKYGVKDDVIELAEQIKERTGIEIKFYKGKHGDNGYFDDSNNTLSVNINSGNSVAQIIAHETTHMIETYSGEAYESLYEAMKEFYGKSYERHKREITDDEFYSEQIEKIVAKAEKKGKDGKKAKEKFIRDEMMARFVEQKLLTNEQSLERFTNFARTNPEKVVDAINDTIIKLAGNKESKALVGFRKLWQQAYSEAVDKVKSKDTSSKGKDTNIPGVVENSDADVRKSIEESSNGEKYVNVDEDFFENVEDENHTTKEFLKALRFKIKSTFKNGVTVHNQTIQIDSNTLDEWVSSKSSKMLRKNNYQHFIDKMRAFHYADELVKASRAYINEKPKHNSYPFFARGIVDFKVMERGYCADIIVGIDNKGTANLYDIVKIGTKKIEKASANGATSENQNPPGHNAFPESNIPQYYGESNTDNETLSVDVKRNSRDIDTEYLTAVKNGDLETEQKFIDEAALEWGAVSKEGKPIHLYHGTKRADRVGNVFRPDRATSGPMAFFTDSYDIAYNYSNDKQDTSIAYDSDYDSYETQFRAKSSKYNLDMPLYKAWGYIPMAERNEIKRKAGQARLDWDNDDYDNFILDKNNTSGLGNFTYELKRNNGNAISALIVGWLNSGELLRKENRFFDVLDITGITESLKKIGFEIEYKDPYYEEKKVYDCYLKITNPFDTNNVDEKFVRGFENWYKEQDSDAYRRESASADPWDKNNISAEEFAENLRSDIKEGITIAWTSIPNSVTDYLKSLGYDGIKDTGGKHGGDIHTVWIPFSSNQIKSADPITYDDNGEIILPSERFNQNKDDIRYSRDTEYFAAIENGDMETVQRMVDEAAREAGYNTKAYHGTNYYKPITVFKKGKKGLLGGAIYTTTDYDTAKRYANRDTSDGGTVYSVYVKFDNPLLVTTDNPTKEILDTIRRKGVYEKRKDKNSFDVNLISNSDSKLIREKYDSIVWDEGYGRKEIAFFNPNQIKSADPITYDDNGNIIPLSQRFDVNKDDIRWSRDVNSGYSGYSMSNRAVEAYESGEKPISKWTKKDIIEFVTAYAEENEISFDIETLKKLPLRILKDLVLRQTSWHHTSEYFNKTDFYSVSEDVLDTLTNKDIQKANIEGKAEVKENPKYKGDIKYIEWEGTRNRPKAVEKELTDVTIEEKGKFYIVYDNDGNQILRKMIGSNGTYVTSNEEKKRRAEAEKEILRKREERNNNMRNNSSAEALAFYDSLKYPERSNSGHIYAEGRKPNRWNYDEGLDKFFKVGENRLLQDNDGTLYLETWDGNKWVQEDNARYSIDIASANPKIIDDIASLEKRGAYAKALSTLNKYKQESGIAQQEAERNKQLEDADRRYSFNTDNPAKLLSLFSGIGAFEKAFRNIGLPFEVVGYCEKDNQAAKVYSKLHNVDEAKNIGDIKNVDINNLPEADIITNGFPCVDFSPVDSRNGMYDVDGNLTDSGLVIHALRIIEAVQPKVVISENSDKLMSKKFAKERKYILDALDQAGYNSYIKVLDAQDYGIPQHRERTIIVSIRKDIKLDYEFPTARERTSNIWDYIGENPKGNQGQIYRDKDYVALHSAKKSHKMRVLDKQNNPDASAFTITASAKGDRDDDTYINDGIGVRGLTTEERWKLMGFTDDDLNIAKSVSKKSQLQKQSGNSIVVPLAEDLAKSIFYTDNEALSVDTKRYSRDIEEVRLTVKEKQTALDEAAKKYRSIAESEEYKKILSRLDDKTEDINEIVKDIASFEKTSGLADAKKAYDIASEEYSAAIRQFNEMKSNSRINGIAEYRKQYGDEFNKKMATKAARYFGTTNNMNLAGYLSYNGSFINFSYDGMSRNKDHREIEDILDFQFDSNYSDSLIEFMNMGNIRLQNYGIDISVKPNENQRKPLIDYINRTVNRDGEFYVDFSDENGNNIDSISYEYKVSGRKVLSDIDYFFDNGEVPYKSDFNKFRYSRDTEDNLSLGEDYTEPLDSESFDEEFDYVVSCDDEELNLPKKKKSKRIVLPGKREEDNPKIREQIDEWFRAEADEIPTITGVDYSMAEQLTGRGVSEGKDYARNFDAASKGDKSVRTWLQNLFVRPLEKAKGEYTNAIKNKTDEMYDYIVQELGIKKGSKESAAVQWYGEGEYTDKQGKKYEYTLDMLQSEFPEKWEDIKKAAEWFRKMYDEYLEDINKVREEIYPNPLWEAEEELKTKGERIDKYGKEIKELNSDISWLQQKIDALEVSYQEASGSKQKHIAKEIAEKREQLAESKKRISELNARLFMLRADIEEVEKKLKDGDYLRNKRITPRKDYFHHFYELSAQLGDIFSFSNNAADIDPRLEGVSETTEPKSKFSKITLHRNNGRYTPDAVGGMLRYIQIGEYMIHIDPVIAKFRAHIKGIAEATKDTRNCNKLIRWLQHWVNDLCGKTQSADRVVQDMIGRNWMNIIRTLNSRAKANAVGGNLNSALAQFFNIPNLTGHINPVTNIKDYIDGLNNIVKFIIRNAEIRSLVKQSNFINERYIDDCIRRFDEKMLDKPNKLATWTLTVGDRYSTVFIWFVALRHAQRKGMENPVEYADDIARRSVAGRGIGEIPLRQKTLYTQLLAPFQIEVNNTWQLYKEKVVGAKQAETKKEKAKLLNDFATILVANFVMNTGTDLLIGRRVVFDPLYVFFSWLGQFLGDDDDDDKPGFLDLMKWETGELLSNIPYASLISYYLMDNSWARENFFGDYDPTRYGVGAVAVEPFVDLLTDLGNGNDILDDFKTILFTYGTPIGGKQLSRFLDGLVDMGVLPHMEFKVSEDGHLGLSFSAERRSPGAYDKKGNLKFPVAKFTEDVPEALLAMIFGKYATAAGQKFNGRDKDNPLWKNILGWNKVKEGSALSTRATETFEKLAGLGADRFEVFDVLQNIKAADNDIEKRDALINSELTDTEKLNILMGAIVNEDYQESEMKKVDAVLGMGLTMDDYLNIRNISAKIGKQDIEADSKVAMLVSELAAEGYDGDTIKQLAETFPYFNMAPASTDNISDLLDSGLSPKSTSLIANAVGNLEAPEGEDSIQTWQKVEAISKLGLSDEETEKALKLYMGESAYIKYKDSNISSDTYVSVMKEIGKLEPTEEGKSVSELQKLNAIAGLGLSELEEKAAIRNVVSDTSAPKYNTMLDMGVRAADYVAFKQALYNADANNADETKRNGSYDTEEIKAAISAAGFSGTKAAVLYQSSTSAKPENNPYDAAAGNAYKLKRDIEKARIAGLKEQESSNLQTTSTTVDEEEAHSPLESYTKVSSGYGYRTDPISSQYAMHHGIDFAAPKGTAALSTCTGTVTQVTKSSTGYGNCVRVTDANGYVHLYGHLSSINVTEGDSVVIGQKVGGVGSTGKSTGYHLHYEVRKPDGVTSVDPNSYEDLDGDGILTVDTGEVYVGGSSSSGGNSSKSTKTTTNTTSNISSNKTYLPTYSASNSVALSGYDTSSNYVPSSSGTTPTGRGMASASFGTAGTNLPKTSSVTLPTYSKSTTGKRTQRTSTSFS